MKNINNIIQSRRSVRTFDGTKLEPEQLDKLQSYTETIKNPFGVAVGFEFMDAAERGLSSPVLSGEKHYVCGRVENIADSQVAFGYSFEKFVLYAQSLGLGTVWIGGTMNRAAFEQATGLRDNELMPCVTPIGRAADKMSVREVLMRKGVKADERLPFEELFFDGSFDKPLSPEAAGALAQPLEMVRLAPSAVNKQPWRVLLSDGKAHFYLRRGKGFGHSEKLDMQMIDMGIALCHFELSAREAGLEPLFCRENPQLASDGMEYIASYKTAKR